MSETAEQVNQTDASVRARWTSSAAGDIAVAVTSVMHQTRIATNPVMRSHMVAIARDQWRNALAYERKLIAFRRALIARPLVLDGAA